MARAGLPSRRTVVDLHSHILPGLDDGAPDVEASVALARAAVAAGTTTLVATPHVSLTYDTRPEAVTSGIEALRARLADEHIPLELVAGAEIAPPRLPELDADALAALAIGDGPYLLVESPYSASPFLEETVFGLMTRGFKPILAHPERCPLFQRNPSQLERLVAQGVLCSITAGALSGRFGRVPQRFGYELVGGGLAHDISSDAHDTDRRPPGLGEGLAALVEELPELAPQVDWFARDAPEAIVRGAPLPARPAADRARERPRWRRQLTDWRRR